MTLFWDVLVFNFHSPSFRKEEDGREVFVYQLNPFSSVLESREFNSVNTIDSSPDNSKQIEVGPVLQVNNLCDLLTPVIADVLFNYNVGGRNSAIFRSAPSSYIQKPKYRSVSSNSVRNLYCPNYVVPNNQSCPNYVMSQIISYFGRLPHFIRPLLHSLQVEINTPNLAPNILSGVQAHQRMKWLFMTIALIVPFVHSEMNISWIFPTDPTKRSMFKLSPMLQPLSTLTFRYNFVDFHPSKNVYFSASTFAKVSSTLASSVSLLIGV